MDKQEKAEINDCLQKIKNGDSGAVHRLYEVVGFRFEYIALKYLKNNEDAEDLIQDFWADIFEIADGFYYFKNGYSYLSKVIKNRALNRYHQIYGEKKHVTEYVDYSQIRSFENPIVNLEYKLAVEEAFKTMTHQQRVIMQLRIFEDKKIEDIAKELNMSKSDVSRKKLEAEEKLKKALF